MTPRGAGTSLAGQTVGPGLVLDTSRHPQWPADVPHQYEDKYLLAEFVATNSIAALQHILQTLGVTEKILVQLKECVYTTWPLLCASVCVCVGLCDDARPSHASL